MPLGDSPKRGVVYGNRTRFSRVTVCPLFQSSYTTIDVMRSRQVNQLLVYSLRYENDRFYDTGVRTTLAGMTGIK